MEQFDVFGETHSLEPAVVKPRDASGEAWTQSRLFEPQMEGQLALESGTAPPQGRRAGTTTEKESTSNG